MRPINKGLHPITPQRGKKMVLNDWTKAIPFLKQRTGDYCHICEMKVTNMLAIEHIKPQIHFPKLASHWDNFLLSCTYCNTNKTTKIPLSPYRKNYFWPHLHNTLLAFDHDLRSVEIKPQNNLSSNQIQRANNTINLYELNKKATTQGNADMRYIEKLKTTKYAIDCYMEYQQNRITIKRIVSLAETTGFFSVWYQIFKGEPQVLSVLIQCPAFCIDNTLFDSNFNPIARNQNDL